MLCVVIKICLAEAVAPFEARLRGRVVPGLSRARRQSRECDRENSVLTLEARNLQSLESNFLIGTRPTRCDGYSEDASGLQYPSMTDSGV